jgi:hypothetical protein
MRMTSLAGAAIAASLLACPAAAQTEAEQAQIEAAVERGRLLFLYDRVAALATRDMLSRVEDPEAAGITGFVVTPEGEGQEVVFYADGADELVAVYRARVANGRIAEREIFAGDERPALSPLQLRMAAARAGAGRTDRQSCADDAPFNVTVIPPEAEDGPVEVYLFTPQTARGRFPAGGHYRAVYAADGTQIESRSFAAGCQMLSAEGAVPGIETEALYLTHAMDPVPTEIHVFLSLWSGKPIVVGAGERSWRVDRNGIRLEAEAAAE